MNKQMMTPKEYAKHVDTDVRTVRRWMRNGLVKFTPAKGHRARLINSSQPRPRPKKRKKQPNTTANQNIKRASNVPRQVDKQTAKPNPTTNVIRQADKQPAKVKPTANVPSEINKQPAKVNPTAKTTRQVDNRPANAASQPRQEIAGQDSGRSLFVLLFIIAIAKPVMDLLGEVFKKKPEQGETSRSNPAVLSGSAFGFYET